MFEQENAGIMKSIDELLSYWDSIPLTLEIPANDAIFRRKGKITRDAILQILSDGTIDKKKKRHALSAKEIDRQLRERFPDNYTDEGENPPIDPNIYFHLNRLEEFGFIQVVGRLQKGKRFTSYYGKRAKIIFVRDKRDASKKEYNLFDDPALVSFIQQFQPDLDGKEIKDLVLQMKRKDELRMEQFTQWAERNEEIIQQTSISPTELSALFSYLYNYDDQLTDATKKIRDILDIS